MSTRYRYTAGCIDSRPKNVTRGNGISQCDIGESWCTDVTNGRETSIQRPLCIACAEKRCAGYRNAESLVSVHFVVAR